MTAVLASGAHVVMQCLSGRGILIIGETMLVSRQGGVLCTLLSFFSVNLKIFYKIKFIKKIKRRDSSGNRKKFSSYRDLIWGEEKYFNYIIVIFFHIVHFLYWKCIYLMFTIWVL